MSRYSKNKMSNWVAGIAVHRSARAIFITLLVALFMVMTSALPALASDGKIYPGSMGVVVFSSGRCPIPTIMYSAIGNPCISDWLYLDLPVIHNTIRANINSSWVRVIDQHNSSDISCQICSVYRCGCRWYGSFSPTKYSSGSGCYEQVLSPAGIGGNIRSHYYFSCKIPPRYNNKTSYIISYKVVEGRID